MLAYLGLVNPFVFIRGLSCPNWIKASLSLNCFKLTIPGFPHNCLPVYCGDIGFLKNILGLVLAWKSGLKVPFLPLWRSCPSANYSADWSGRVWQPTADSNDLLAPLLSTVGCHTRPRNFKFKQKVRQTSITICRGLSHPTGLAALLSDNISGRFFKSGETKKNNPMGWISY
jgi:hypothetical protein